MKRLLTAIAGIPVVLLLAWRPPEWNWVFALAMAVVGCLCSAELLAMARQKGVRRPGGWIAVLGAVVTGSFAAGPQAGLLALSLALLVALALMTFGEPVEAAFPSMAVAAFALAYCSALPGFVILLDRRHLIVVLAVVWVGDAAAYYVGRTLGRRKLAPRISPNKTIEGSLGGLAGSMIAGLLVGGWLKAGAMGTLAMGSLIAAIMGQIGDLTESALKRSAGVKDSSTLLPGHGGMLDRVDSLLFAAPAFYWFLNVSHVFGV